MNTSKKPLRGARGFTLIELLVTVAIVGIIAAVAYPSYRNQVYKSNRAQGKARLVQAAQLLERFYSDNNSYFVDVSGGNLVVGTASTASGFAKLMVGSGTAVYSDPENSANSPYVVTLATPTASSFTLTATRQGGQVNDTKCGNLTLTNTGVRGVTGTGTVSDCW